MPGVRCARSRAWCVESTRVSHHGHTGITRHSPRNGFNGLIRAPRRPGFLATVVDGVASTDLTPASGRQDHTTSPSASVPFVSVLPRPPHPALTSVTIAKRPSEWAGPNRNNPVSTSLSSEIRIFRNRSPPRPGSVRRRGAENSALRPPAGFVMRQFAVAKPDRHGMVRTNARRYQRSSVTCRNATLSWPSDAAARALAPAPTP